MPKVTMQIVSFTMNSTLRHGFISLYGVGMSSRSLRPGGLRIAVGISAAARCSPAMRCLALSCLLLGACMTPESDCRTGDWYALGERDARFGLRPQIELYA